MFRKLAQFALALLVFTAGPLGVARAEGANSGTSGLEWRWDDEVERTWFVDNQVLMPSYLWLMADQNQEARLVAFRTRMVLTCTRVDRGGPRSDELACVIGDFAIVGASQRGDKGLLQPILEEMDEKLTGATLQVVLRHDGRIVGVDLEGVDARNRRESRMLEAMRIILARSIAGFDLQLPRKGVAEDNVWAQFQSTLLAAPSDRGTLGASEIAHLVRQQQGDYAIIESAGKAMIVPAEGGEGRNFFDTELDSVAAFDVSEGMLKERVWSARGNPTASSVLAEGGAGVTYLQAGKILYLPEGSTAPNVGETQEVAPPSGRPDSSILDWNPLGGRPR